MSKMATTALIRADALKNRGRAAVATAAVMLLAGCGAGTADLRAANGGRLAPCDSGPHCVSSQATDPDRHVAPLTYSGPRATARQHLEKVIADMPGAKIVEQRPDYIHATYTSSVFGFVDDLECVLPADKQEIDVRSSSRIGYYDFGMNASRVKTLRKRFETPAS